MKEINYSAAEAATAAQVVDFSAVAFSKDGGVNPRKRPLPISFVFAENVSATQISQQRDEFDRLLQTQGEHLRRALEARRQALIGEATETAARRMEEKEAEVKRALRRRCELEDRLVRLRAELAAWQEKVAADRAATASLKAQLQQVRKTKEMLVAEDAESTFVDPRRLEPRRACRSCSAAAMSVVALPCRHLALCPSCAVTTRSCPVCRCPQTGTVQVFLC